MAPKIAVVYYSLGGHIRTLAEVEAKAIREAGGSVDIYQLPETLPDVVLEKMHAAPKSTEHPVLKDPTTLLQYDAYIFGIPTRFGAMPTQWRQFWDSTGQIWMKGGFHGKMFGAFVSTSALGGGQEATFLSSMSTFAHHGMIFVPLGGKNTGHLLGNLESAHGGSGWGAGTLSGHGERQPSQLELELAEIQGKTFWGTVSRFGPPTA